jgi:hypothetical protein
MHSILDELQLKCINGLSIGFRYPEPNGKSMSGAPPAPGRAKSTIGGKG